MLIGAFGPFFFFFGRSYLVTELGLQAAPRRRPVHADQPERDRVPPGPKPAGRKAVRSDHRRRKRPDRPGQIPLRDRVLRTAQVGAAYGNFDVLFGTGPISRVFSRSFGSISSHARHVMYSTFELVAIVQNRP